MADKFASSVDVSGEDIHWDMKDKMTYAGYLGLDTLLASQNPLTDEHDEMLFILIHQVGELWMKLILHETAGAVAHLQRDEIGPALKMFTRVARIQEQLIAAWDVLSTMTPADYLAFRDKLGQSSGFQSFQYRTIEFRLGNKNAELARGHKSHWEAYELGEKLVDLEHKFQQWRFNHMKTVERIIGFRRGTGGTSGVGYLVKALDLRFFPEIWTVRTSL